MRSILDYNSFREYLVDYYKAMKSSNPNWSYSVWCKEVGNISIPTMINYLKGKTNLGISSAKGVMKHLNLVGIEQKYATILVWSEKMEFTPNEIYTILEESMSCNGSIGEVPKGATEALAALSVSL